MATKEEVGCTIKGESMDAVHGRSGVTKAGKATVQPGRWAGAGGAQDAPHGEVVLGVQRQTVSLSPKWQFL